MRVKTTRIGVLFDPGDCYVLILSFALLLYIYFFAISRITVFYDHLFLFNQLIKKTIKLIPAHF